MRVKRCLYLVMRARTHTHCRSRAGILLDFSSTSSQGVERVECTEKNCAHCCERFAIATNSNTNRLRTRLFFGKRMTSLNELSTGTVVHNPNIGNTIVFSAEMRIFLLLYNEIHKTSTFLPSEVRLVMAEKFGLDRIGRHVAGMIAMLGRGRLLLVLLSMTLMISVDG